MTACSDKSVTLHALVDGELDALATIAIEDHLRSCPECRAEFDRLQQLRVLVGQQELRHSAPAHLRHKIESLAAAPTKTPASSWRPWLGGGAIGAVAASLAAVVLLPLASAPNLTDELVDNQVRSLQTGHLIDVATSDRHVVKPWFNGKVDFAPQVVDLAADGFPLIGGRLDVLDHQRVAVLVYGRRLHKIGVFIRSPSGPLKATARTDQRSGTYNLAQWTAGGLEYWAVSDLEQDELDMFAQLLSKQQTR